MRGAFTFAVVGHNEAERLHVAVAQALDAAGPGDRVWFVDSASDDDSARVASALGAEIIEAPLGKGRAIGTALARCETDYISFADADMESSTCNIPATLRDAVIATDADMVVGSFTEPTRRPGITLSVYVPFVEALFPEAVAAPVVVPLSGLRALRSGIELGVLPPRYGIETHLNVHVAMTTGSVANTDLGVFVGPMRGYTNIPAMTVDVASALLDLAEAHGRLCAAERPEWEAWAQPVIDALSTQPPVDADGTEHLERLGALAARPLPSRAET